MITLLYGIYLDFFQFVFGFFCFVFFFLQRLSYGLKTVLEWGIFALLQNLEWNCSVLQHKIYTSSRFFINDLSDWKVVLHSRQGSSRTWNSPPPTNTSKIHLQMEQFSQNTYWTPAEDLKHLKGQERSLRNQVGRQEKKRGSGTGPAHLGGSWKRGKVTALWEAPSLAGGSARTEKELQRLIGECSTRFVAGRTERDLHGCPCHCPVHPSCLLGGFLCQPPPQQALGAGISGLPTHRGGTETTAEPQGLCDSGSRAEISQCGCVHHGFTPLPPAL